MLQSKAIAQFINKVAVFSKDDSGRTRMFVVLEPSEMIYQNCMRAQGGLSMLGGMLNGFLSSRIDADDIDVNCLIEEDNKILLVAIDLETPCSERECMLALGEFFKIPENKLF